MNHIRNFQERAALRARTAAPRGTEFLLAEFVSYDPATMLVTATIQNHFDPNESLTPTKTMRVPLMSPFMGGGYGQQYYPPANSQVVLLRSGDGDQFIAIGFLANNASPPPDPTLQVGEHTTVNATGAKQKLGLTQVVTAASDGSQTIHDAVTHEVAHVAASVALGARAAALDSTQAALNQSHLTTFENSLKAKRLDDLSKFATAMVTAGVPNAGAVLALVASLVSVPIPSGSSVVEIKS